MDLVEPHCWLFSVSFAAAFNSGVTSRGLKITNEKGYLPCAMYVLIFFFFFFLKWNKSETMKRLLCLFSKGSNIRLHKT